ncbi:MAG: tetratricopeptide repeat protein [Vicinamibacterales bacterium]
MTRVLAIVAGVLALLGAARPAQAQAPPSGRILVMPFENVTREGRIVWLGEAAAVLVADDLNALGASAITRDERRQAFDRLEVPPAAALTDATVIRIAQLVQAAQVIVGTLRVEGDDLIVQARAIELDTAKVRAQASEHGPLPDLFALFERVSRQLGPVPEQEADDLERIHPPVAAFEQYIKGVLAETPATAIGYLKAALKIDPSLERARLALWEIYDAQGEHEQALAAVGEVASDAPQARRARFRAGLSQINLGRYDHAFETFKALGQVRLTPPLLNNLGVVQLRRGATPQTGFPTYYFTKAADADATEPDYFFNLGYAYWLEHDSEAAIYWLRETVRRDPADGNAHYLLGAALAASGHAAESAREKELARRLSSVYREWDKRPADDPVPRGLERLKRDVELPHARQIEEALANSGQRDQRELARYYLERARRDVAKDDDRAALIDLNRVVYLSPYEADAHLMIGRIHLRAGRTREAIDALKISLWSRDTVDGRLALAEAYLEAKNYQDARAEIGRAQVMRPGDERARGLLARIPPD